MWLMLFFSNVIDLAEISKIKESASVASIICMDWILKFQFYPIESESSREIIIVYEYLIILISGIIMDGIAQALKLI